MVFSWLSSGKTLVTFINLFDVLNQVLVVRVPDLAAVPKELSDVDAESFDEKIVVLRSK